MQYRARDHGWAAHSARENAIIVVVVLLHLGAAIFLAQHFHFQLRNSLRTSLLLFAACYIMIAGLPFLWLLVRERPHSPFEFLRELARKWKVKERVLVAAPAVLAVGLFLPIFSSLKSAIPAMSPYHLDPLLSHLDTAIHGEDPWRILQPIVGHPWVTFVINWLYHLWVGVFYVIFCLVAVWVEELELRRRFLTAFVLCWALLGNLAATFLASVGPCFYGLFYSHDPYQNLMGYLQGADHIAPLPALKVQASLAAWSHSGMSGLGAGISAMPSMHVSISCLIMLLAWKLGPRWGLAGIVFLFGIMIGSVHLGYHYAVDGYASLIATPVIWWASKHISTLHLRFPSLGPAAEEQPAKA